MPRLSHRPVLTSLGPLVLTWLPHQGSGCYTTVPHDDVAGDDICGFRSPTLQAGVLKFST